MTPRMELVSADGAATPIVIPAWDLPVHHDTTGHKDDAAASTVGQQLDDVVRAQLPGLLRYATVLTGDGQIAADLVQEVLLRAHLRWKHIGMMARPDLYLRRMVTNEHLSWRRTWYVRTVRATDDEVLANHTDTRNGHEDAADQDAVWRHVALLPPRQRTVLVLRYYEGLTDPEIATVLGTSAATVRSHASRALATLRVTDLSTPPEKR